MSDGRPSKLHDPAKALEWWRAEGSKMAIVELYEAVTDPVAAVRAHVESGTIEGEVAESLGVTFGFDEVPEGKDGLILAVDRRAWDLQPMRYLVIPVSDERE